MSQTQDREFARGGRSNRADGWISHYFGKTPDEHRQGAEPGAAATAAFLEHWREQAKGLRKGNE